MHAGVLLSFVYCVAEFCYLCCRVLFTSVRLPEFSHQAMMQARIVDKDKDRALDRARAQIHELKSQLSPNVPPGRKRH